MISTEGVMGKNHGPFCMELYPSWWLLTGSSSEDSMKLDDVRIRGYRSALDARLLDAGNFNVLIGKNNSGKSTILFAIHAFFRCIGRGIISTNPPLGKIIDFSKDVVGDPIRVTLT